jgi:hypothetical protein
MSKHTISHQSSRPLPERARAHATGFTDTWSIAVRYLLLVMLAIGCLAGGRIAPAQGIITVATPNDATMVNNFIPVMTCHEVSYLNCDYSILDTKTNWSSGVIANQVAVGGGGTTQYTGALDAGTPGNCFIWISSCTQQLYYAHINGNNTIALPKPAVNGIYSGVTFRLKVYTQSRASGTQEGTIVSMPGVWNIKTIGPRWALHTFQQSPANGGAGFDLTPWEPYDYPGNVYIYEDVYYTFTPDGRLRIDKFTPYRTFWPLPTYYIWEESINDGGWPSTWNSGQQTFLPVGNLQLGGQADPSTVDNSGTDQFRQLSVYNTALTQDQMIQEENFDHDAGSNLTPGMSPCNTGDWINSTTVSTPCGNGGNQQPVPLPATSVPGFNSGTDSFAPSSIAFSQSTDGTLMSINFTPPPQAPPLSLMQEPTAPAPWSPFYPLTPTGYTVYLQTQDVNGMHSCQSSYPFQGNYFPGGVIYQVAAGADYPLASLDGPNTIATIAEMAPNPQSVATPTGAITVTAGWQCN